MKGLKALFSILCSYSAISVATDSCYSTKPTGCELPPDDSGDVEQIFEIIRNALIFVSPSTSVYTGQTAVFSVSFNKSGNNGVSALAYVDRCKTEEPLCVLEEKSDLYNLTCTIADASESDNGTEFQFYGYYQLAQLCFSPPTYLTVLGPVVISYDIDRCAGVTLTLQSVIVPGNVFKYWVMYDGNISKVIYSEDSVVNVSPDALPNHLGTYEINVVPTHPSAGDGVMSSLNISLHEGSTSLNFSIVDVELRVDSSSNFHSIISIKNVMECVLTISNHFHIRSSCSGPNEVTHRVDMAQILAATNDNGLITVQHSLWPQKHDCSVSIRDDAGNTRHYHTNKGTFHTQDFVINKMSSNMIEVGCWFIKGTGADGCWISVYNATNFTVDEELFRANSPGYVRLGPFPPGNYSVLIHDHINGMKLPRPAFYSTFFISTPKPSPSSVSVERNSSLSTTSSCAACAANHTTDSNTSTATFNRLSTAIVVVVVCVILLTGVVVAVVLVIILVRWCCLRSKPKPHSPISEEDRHSNGQTVRYDKNSTTVQISGCDKHKQQDSIGCATHGPSLDTSSREGIGSPKSKKYHTRPPLPQPTQPTDGTEDSSTGTESTTVCQQVPNLRLQLVDDYLVYFSTDEPEYLRQAQNPSNDDQHGSKVVTTPTSSLTTNPLSCINKREIVVTANTGTVSHGNSNLTTTKTDSTQDYNELQTLL